MDQRAPRAASFRLNRKNLYTFPHLTGFACLGLMAILWLLGTNYQNNLILALAYSVMSILVVAILHAYLNLAAMDVRWLGVQPTFAGQPVEASVELCSANKQGCESVELRFAGGELRQASLDSGAPQSVTLVCPAATRGYWRPGRLLVQSCFPLGIIRCWTWLNLDGVGVVYPAPRVVPEPLGAQADNLADGLRVETGGEDFAGLRVYRPGDPMRHMAWKIFAQDKGLYCKEYSQPQGADTWLDWQSMAVQDTELRLSGLCYWALAYHAQQRPFGLRLPGTEVPIDTGDTHLHQCLTALALFQAVKPA